MIRDPDALRVVWLFRRPYWWNRDGGRLSLERATWINPLSEAEVEEIKARWKETYGKPGTAHPLIVLNEETPDA